MNERITLKTFMGDYALDCESESEWEKTKNKAFNKLGKLEDIEQDLDVNLVDFLEKNKEFLELMIWSANADVVEIDPSIRAYNCLVKAGITKVYQFLEMSEDDINKLPHISKSAAKELIKKWRELHGYIRNND